MERVKISYNTGNYKKDDGSYLLDEHVNYCYNFNEGFGIVQYNETMHNYINEEGKHLLKTNVYYCFNFKNGFAKVLINKIWYYIDKECNFFSYDEVSFKTLYNEYPNMRSKLIEIIEKYTYHNVNEYFNI